MRAEVEALAKQFSTLLGRQSYNQASRIQQIVILHRLLDISKSVHDFWNTQGGTIERMSPELQAQIKMEQNRTQQLVESSEQRVILIQDLERITAENDAEQAKQGNLVETIRKLEADYERVFQDNQQKEEQVIQLKEDYQQLVEKLETMQKSFEPMEMAHQANVTVFKTHFAANKAIWGDMNDGTSPQQHMDKLSKSIESQLKEFDNGLKAVIEQKDKLEISKIKE